MILKKQLFFLFFFSITFVFSQETIKHKVVSGESIYAIAKKYNVTEADIYQLNPKVKGAVLQLNSIIVVPNKNKSKNKTSETNNNLQEHTVTKGETLFAISKHIKTIHFKWCITFLLVFKYNNNAVNKKTMYKNQ